MILTIIDNDNTSKVLVYDDKSEFVKQCNKDNAHLQHAVKALSPNYKNFTTKEVSGGAVVKQHVNIAEKLPVKMRVKNSSQTSKELQDKFHSYFRDPSWRGLLGSLTIRSQHSFIRLN